MANSSKGYAQVNNDILESIYSSDLTLMQKEIVLFVVRFTDGYSRDVSDFSYSFIAKGIGRSRAHVIENVNRLIEKNVLISYVGSKITRLSVNEDTPKWDVQRRSGTAQGT